MKILAVAILLAASPYVPTDAERARWTMHDMKSWMIPSAAYKTDQTEFPRVTPAEQARAFAEPVYIRKAPMTDAWGHPYRIEADGKTFRIISAGADGIFQADLSQTGKLSSFD